MTDQYFEQEPDEMLEFLDLVEEDIENIRRVVRDVRENGIDARFMVHPKAKSAEQSAENTGIDSSQIVKTLVFKAGEEFVAVLCPGDTTVSEEKLEEVAGGDVRMAKPDEVRENTGYQVGGVSPFDLDITVYVEESILEHEEVKPAAGSRVAGIEIGPEDLLENLDAETEDLSR